MDSRIFRKQVISFLLCLLLIGWTAYAENIDPLASDSQYAYQENTGWMNAEPQGDGGPGVTVYADRVEGYIWAENIGWINLSPVSYGGVTNDGDGNLGGYAWSENAGWINFAPTNGGVNIDIFTGEFSGWAWGENIGWVNFNLTTQIGSASRTSWSIWEEDGDPTNNWDANPDGDSLVNLEDPDADNDGLNNDVEYAMWGVSWNTDIDGDGLYNLIDDDADGDGLLDGSDPNPGKTPATPVPAIIMLLLDDG
jgi:hypothetical protein